MYIHLTNNMSYMKLLKPRFITVFQYPSSCRQEIKKHISLNNKMIF